jgi:hypothetical protein
MRTFDQVFIILDFVALNLAVTKILNYTLKLVKKWNQDRLGDLKNILDKLERL